MSDSPLVSVIIPVYNAAKFLTATIESVLGQTYQNIECLAVNDGSTDDSATIARSFGDRIRFFDKPNGGVSTARNLGVREAKGEYIAFLDADDLWVPNKIERQVEAFKHADTLGMIYCGVRFIDEKGNVGGGDGVVSHDGLIRNILSMSGTTGYVSSTAVYKRAVFDDIGNFDTQLSTSADADFVCRLSTRYRIDAIDDALAMYRVHGNQMHHDLAAFDHDMRIVLSKVFANNDQPEHVRALESRAYANLESTLAIGFLSKGKIATGMSHLASAFRYHPATPIKQLTRVVRARF